MKPLTAYWILFALAAAFAVVTFFYAASLHPLACGLSVVGLGAGLVLVDMRKGNS